MNRSPFRTKEEAIEFLQRIGMKKRRVLEGEERDQILTVLALIGPTDVSNNQRTFTETYHHAGKEYEVTYGFSDVGPTPYVEEITEL
jgi:hypothetical protein